MKELGTRLLSWRKARSPRRAAEVTVHDLIWRRSLESSAEFAENNIGSAMLFRNPTDIRRYAVEAAPASGLLMEFGVFKGSSINAFATVLQSRKDERAIYGFDSFLGLSEDWVGHSIKKMDRFNLGGNEPPVEPNVTLIKGWIDDTLPQFLEQNPEPIAFIHIDTDTYSPCKTVLTLCRDRLVEGSVVLFDELLGYPGWKHGEYRALTECLRSDEYRWTAFENRRAMITMV
jgi:hypothetical protein